MKPHQEIQYDLSFHHSEIYRSQWHMINHISVPLLTADCMLLKSWETHSLFFQLSERVSLLRERFNLTRAVVSQYTEEWTSRHLPLADVRASTCYSHRTPPACVQSSRTSSPLSRGELILIKRSGLAVHAVLFRSIPEEGNDERHAPYVASELFKLSLKQTHRRSDSGPGPPIGSRLGP